MLQKLLLFSSYVLLSVVPWILSQVLVTLITGTKHKQLFFEKVFHAFANCCWWTEMWIVIFEPALPLLCAINIQQTWLQGAPTKNPKTHSVTKIHSLGLNHDVALTWKDEVKRSRHFEDILCKRINQSDS